MYLVSRVSQLVGYRIIFLSNIFNTDFAPNRFLLCAKDFERSCLGTAALGVWTPEG